MNVYFTKTKVHSLFVTTLVFGVLFLLPQLLFASAPTDGEKGFIMAGLQGLLYSIVNVVFGTLAGLGGLLLNEAVTTYVVGFGNLYETSGLGYTIDNLWSTVRDIFNLTFIFGLVYIGFKMIFNSGDSSAKRMLGSLVLAALLVNFSLFITKFVIDFSNIAATQLAAGFNTAGTYAVSDGFMNLMGISGLFSTGPSLADKTTSLGFAFIFGSLILYIVAAFVFAAGGLLLIIRFAVLNIYMVLSPLMFLGMVFPGFSGVSREYWQGFLGRAFFAPAYILMLYFAYQILVNMKGAGSGTAQFASVFGSKNPIADFSATIPYFILTAVFMIAALVVAQKMGAQGATTALAIGKRMSTGARKYATNAATYVPRATSRWAVNKGGEAATKRLNNLQTQKGFTGWLAKTNAVDRTVRGAATAATGAKFGTGTTNKANKAYRSQTESRATTNAAIKNGINNASELTRLRGLPPPLSPADDARLKVLEAEEVAMQSAVAGMGTSDIEEMADADRESVAELFTSTQVENINKSDNISNAEKGKVNAARQAAINKLIGTTGAFITSELNKLSIHQIETLGETWIAQNAHVLSDSQMDDVRKSKKFTESQKNSFGAKRNSEYTATAAMPVGPAATSKFEQIFKDKKPKDIAKLPANLLQNSTAWQYLSAAALKEIATSGPLSPAEQRSLQASLTRMPWLAHPTATGYFGSAHATANWG